MSCCSGQFCCCWCQRQTGIRKKTRKRLRPIDSVPDLCSANKRSLCKTIEGAARAFLRAWLRGRYRTKGSHLAQGRIRRFHPKAAGASLANNALRCPSDRSGRRREQLIGMGLPDKSFARSEILVFPVLLIPKHSNVVGQIHLKSRSRAWAKCSDERGVFHRGLERSCFC